MPAISSLDYLVGEGEQRRRHGETKHPRGSGVDNQLEFGGLHDRQVRWLLALEDAARIDAHLTISILQVRSVAHQTAGFSNSTRPKYRRASVASRQDCQLDTAAAKKRASADEQSIWPLVQKDCEGRIDLAAGAGVDHLDVQPHRASSCLDVPDQGFGWRKGRIDEGTNANGRGCHFAQQLQPFCSQL